MAMNRGFIKRIGKQWIIIENERMQEVRVPSHLLPPNADIGDFLYEVPEYGVYEIDHEITEARRREIARLCGRDFS